MFGTEHKVKQFVAEFPALKTFLLDLYKVEEKTTKEEIDSKKIKFDETKEEVIEKAKKLLDANTVNIELLPSNQGSKYSLEVLEKDHSDYKLIKQSLDKHTSNNKTLKMHRIIPTDTAENQSITSECSDILLLHGTKGSNVKGILKEGFKPSTNGRHGPGVYLTNYYHMASGYSGCYVNNQGLVKESSFVLVNRVKKTEESQRRYKGNNVFQEYTDKEAIVQTFNYKSGNQINEPEDPEQTKYDSNNNRIIQGTFNCEEKSNIVLAHHDLVIPAYLIEIQENVNVKTMVDDLLQLKGDSKFQKIMKTKAISLMKASKVDYKDKNLKSVTLKDLTTELENELVANQETQLNYIIEQLDCKMSSVMQQLSFQFISLFETKHNENDKN